MNIVIFSKDRPAQLDLLLESMNKYCNSWRAEYNVIYTFSSSAFKEGYEKVIHKYKEFNFIKQENFSLQLLDIIKKSKIIGLITDDSLFYKESKQPFLDDVGVYSCRYGLNTVMQDPFNKTYQPILNKFTTESETIKWNSLWYHPLNNYGFQCSMDGHFYKSKNLLEMINFEFSNPSQLESNLFNRRQIINPWIRSEKESSLVNIPLNNAGGYTNFIQANLEEINKKYLEGKKIKYKIDKIIGCHQILDWSIE